MGKANNIYISEMEKANDYLKKRVMELYISVHGKEKGTQLANEFIAKHDAHENRVHFYEKMRKAGIELNQKQIDACNEHKQKQIELSLKKREV